MKNDYKFKKNIFTLEDFDEINWKDTTIYGFVFSENQLVIDVDYIVGWKNPDKSQSYYNFWISPATIVFENVNELEVHISEPYRNIQIESIYKDSARKPRNSEYLGVETEWKWLIEAHNSEISFYSIGYKMFLRKSPILTQQQNLSLVERNGFSFDTNLTVNL